ncbi:DNA helicase [Tanacetum coccineum]
MATLIKEMCLIIWDEFPMNDRRCFETFDRTLRDILDAPNRIFGGKMVMLGGDFRQTSPVNKATTRDEIIRSSVAKSYLWPHFKIGTPNDSDPENTSWIYIPDEYCIPDDDNGIANLISFIYDDDTLQHPSAVKLQDMAIIYPKNDMAYVINTGILSLLTTTTQSLNTLAFTGLPPHRIMATASNPDKIAETKGKMIAVELEVTSVANLRPTDCNKTFEVIVYRKWTSEHVQTRQPTKFCCILMDKQGTTIQANMDVKDADGNIIGLTLWHEMALNFNMQLGILIAGRHKANPEHRQPAVPRLGARKKQEPIPSSTLLEVNPQNYQGTRFPIAKTTDLNQLQSIGDGSATISVTCFSNQANSLIRDCNELLAELSNKDPYQLPSTLRDLECTAHIFQFHFDAGNTTTKPLSPELSTTASNEPDIDEGTTGDFQQPQPPPHNQTPMETKQGGEPCDPPSLSAEEVISNVNPKNETPEFNKPKADEDVKEYSQDLQSTPPQIQVPTETHKGN